jgi:hypothetical protein
MAKALPVTPVAGNIDAIRNFGPGPIAEMAILVRNFGC